MVGERVLVSRAQDGENHEEATVVDFYELLIERRTRSRRVVVDFDDGQRLYADGARAGRAEIVEEDEADDAESAESSSEPTSRSGGRVSGAARRRLALAAMEQQTGTMRVKSGLAEMLKGGVIMDVVTRRPGADRRGGRRGRGDGARARARRHPARRAASRACRIRG